MDNLKMIEGTDKASSSGQMVEFIMEAGKLANNTVKVLL
jgi:hypothetical protein